mgnify:CR=1 FL=1
MIQKIVITAAGLGTRLLPITKEIPKEMMPVFLHGKNGELVVKPLIQTIFEQFFHQGLREYCIIMGRQKRIIQDHFTIDEEFLKKILGLFDGMSKNEVVEIVETKLRDASQELEAIMPKEYEREIIKIECSVRDNL